MEKKTCFVVMGFGKKTDFATGRVLDLYKSYSYIIKPAAEGVGLERLRSDEIVHSGTIDMQGNTQTVSVLMNQAGAAINASNFALAKSLLAAVKAIAPNDPYVAQKLALATYKSKMPTSLEALREARAILCELKPDISTDTETLGLWGSVHKRLWELTGERANLEAAIFAHEKGFCLKNDYWNGINLAFLYDLRAAASEGTSDHGAETCGLDAGEHSRPTGKIGKANVMTGDRR